MSKIRSPLYEHPLIFEHVMGYLSRKRYRQIAELVGEKTVLELGCGTGKLGDFLDGDYIGIDLNSKFIEHGRKKGRDVRLGDIQKTGDIDQDVIVLMDVLHHLPNHREFFEGVLERGKTVIVSEPFDSNGLLLPIATIIDWDGINNSNHKWFSRQELQEFFKSKGTDNIIDDGQHITAVFQG